MCFRVTVVLPETTNIKAVREISKEYGFTFDKINNPHVMRQLLDNEIYLSSTDYGCECYTGIGAYAMYNRNIIDVLQGLTNKDLIKVFVKEDSEKKKIYKSEVDNWFSLIKNLIDNNYIISVVH